MMRIEFAPARMTKELAAYYLSISQREIDNLHTRREITAYGNGKNAYFHKSDLDEYIEREPERRL